MRTDDWLIGQLPMGMLDDNFFLRFASMFQAEANTHLAQVDNIPNLLDVAVAPAAIVRWLGTWLGMAPIKPSLPDDLQRRIVRESGEILAWRGTRRGVQQFLELMSGGPVTIEDSGGVFRAGLAGEHERFVRIRVASTGYATEAEFIDLVRDEIAVDVRLEILVGDRVIWPVVAPAPVDNGSVP